MPTTNPANKVRYGLKNVHVAKLTESDQGVVAYGTPQSIPGAVNLDLPPVGETTPFYADDIEYFTSVVNNGYEGTLEVAIITDWFKENILNETKDANNVYTENSLVQPERFALLFEFDGDANKTRYVLYNCKAARPNVKGNTKTNTITPTTETLNIVVKPLADGKVKSRTTPDTPTSAYNAWYTSVYTVPTTGGGT